MTVNDFIRLRENDWDRLQALVQRHQGHAALSPAEIHELDRLYRAAISDLAQAQRDYPGQRVTAFLNQLLTQAHTLIYRREATDFFSIRRAITRTIPDAFQRTAAFTLVAVLLFFVPALVGFQLARHDPSVAGPLGLSSTRAALEDQAMWTDIPVEQRPYASAFIMTNNIRVALLAFGGGMALGLFSVYLLAMNGLILGAVFGLAVHYGLGGELLNFVFAHGVLELSVICIAGGAGLQLGWAIISPGRYARRDAVMLAAQRAAPLAVVGIVMLIVAGTIEGFLSPSDAPFAIKVLVGLTSGALFYAYLLYPRRTGRPARQGT